MAPTSRRASRAPVDNRNTTIPKYSTGGYVPYVAEVQVLRDQHAFLTNADRRHLRVRRAAQALVDDRGRIAASWPDSVKRPFSCTGRFSSSLTRMDRLYAPSGTVRSLANSVAYWRAAVTASAETDG